MRPRQRRTPKTTDHHPCAHDTGYRSIFILTISKISNLNAAPEFYGAYDNNTAFVTLPSHHQSAEKSGAAHSIERWRSDRLCAGRLDVNQYRHHTQRKPELGSQTPN
jgi:hypothetical protein